MIITTVGVRRINQPEAVCVGIVVGVYVLAHNVCVLRLLF